MSENPFKVTRVSSPETIAKLKEMSFSERNTAMSAEKIAGILRETLGE